MFPTGCKYFFTILIFVSPIFFNACDNAVILNSKGSIGLNETSLITKSLGLMLIVVLPAILMTFLFSWRYRESNKKANYAPEWKNSKTLEIITWIIPSIIVLVLSVFVWTDSHKLDPYQPIQSNRTPITIQVVSLDWKWLFIYPEQKIATVNILAFPADVPVHFLLTAQTVMNSFFIPQLGSQIMTMAGMQTQLHLIANSPGIYDGISANFSGMGFTDMKFKVIASSEKEFGDWVENIKNQTKKLDKSAYSELAKSSINHPVEYFSFVEPKLFEYIINLHGRFPPAAFSRN